MKPEFGYDNMFCELSQELKGIVTKDELLKKHTYFKIGGPASVFADINDKEDLCKAFDIIRKYKANYYIMGNGTNMLFSDCGFDGVVLKIGSGFNFTEIEGNHIRIGAGTLLSSVAHIALEAELAGFEFASGIPGYVGGAVCMNAGAYGGEMKDVITKVTCVNSYGKEFVFLGDEMRFGYRHSVVTDKDLIVTETEITLKKGCRQQIATRISELNEKRISKQPINMPSAGSTFKRPISGYASKMIEDAGLKGLIYRGAMVSDKHSGFIVNRGDATCDDVLNLMRIVIGTVKDKFGVTLEPEVKIIGNIL